MINQDVFNWMIALININAEFISQLQKNEGKVKNVSEEFATYLLYANIGEGNWFWPVGWIQNSPTLCGLL